MSQSLAALPLAEADAGFAATVRERTKLVHREAERAGFIADLLQGRAATTGYALFLRNLHPAYAAMEPALTAWADHPLAGAFADPAFTASKRFLPTSAPSPGPTGRPYLCSRKQRPTRRRSSRPQPDPARLAGHAYARYLGDLSGGQILKPLLARMLGLGPDALAFYDFPAFTDLAAPKLALRAALDAVPVASDAAQALCSEAILAFRHNIAVSEAVQASFAEP